MGQSHTFNTFVEENAFYCVEFAKAHFKEPSIINKCHTIPLKPSYFAPSTELLWLPNNNDHPIFISATKCSATYYSAHHYKCPTMLSLSIILQNTSILSPPLMFLPHKSLSLTPLLITLCPLKGLTALPWPQSPYHCH